MLLSLFRPFLVTHINSQKENNLLRDQPLHFKSSFGLLKQSPELHAVSESRSSGLMDDRNSVTELMIKTWRLSSFVGTMSEKTGLSLRYMSEAVSGLMVTMLLRTSASM